MSGLLGYFSFDKKKPTGEKTEKQQPIRALPASWYTSPAMYDFERRAIFANRWLFMTSTLRLPTAGDYVRYQFAGYDVLILRDRGNEIRALHNQSKQTKQRLVEDTTDNAAGHLDPASLSTASSDMFPIHTHLDRNSFIWINMDAAPTPSIPFTQHFLDVDVQARYAPISFPNYTLHHIYTLQSSYNWKLAADNFNECYHCPTTHPDIPAFLNLDSFDSHCKAGHIQHACQPTQEQVDLGVNVHSTYYFPFSSMTVGKHFLMVQKFLPVSEARTVCHYEVFKGRASSDDEFHRIADMYARVMREDKALCERAQANLERGVFEAGWLHPRYEKAPIFFQGGCREVVREHKEREGREGVVNDAVQEGLRFGEVEEMGEGEGGGEEGEVGKGVEDGRVELRSEVLACG
jgi:phenylpropionate dioxygenase-like ring-hydroxylating dioxygenase large terminal subunit